jgi:hypothetical protein
MMTTITSISNNSTITVALTPAINSGAFPTEEDGLVEAEVSVGDGKTKLDVYICSVSLAITAHDPYPLIV